MAKSKKKRTKRYQGEDAAIHRSSQPVVHRVTAIDRGRFGQWWFEKKKSIKIISGISAALAFVIWLFIELFQMIL